MSAERSAATEDDYVDDFGHDLACTHCGGEGICEDNCDPLWYESIHPCHACNGTGNRKDQVIF